MISCGVELSDIDTINTAVRGSLTECHIQHTKPLRGWYFGPGHHPDQGLWSLELEQPLHRYTSFWLWAHVDPIDHELGLDWGLEKFQGRNKPIDVPSMVVRGHRRTYIIASLAVHDHGVYGNVLRHIFVEWVQELKVFSSLCGRNDHVGHQDMALALVGTAGDSLQFVSSWCDDSKVSTRAADPPE